MNDFDDLDDVFGPLRSAATPAELASESAIVDAMARNHRHTKGSTMFSSRRIRVAAFVAAGVLGFSGVAAAGYGDSLDTSELEFTTTENEEDLEEVVDEVEEEVEEGNGEEVGGVEEEVVNEEEDLQVTQVILEESVDAEVADDDGEEEPDDPDESTDFNEAYCLDGNHGKTVSAAARGDEEYLEKIGENEYTQSQVAQSSCGKDYEEIEGEDIDDLDMDDVDDDKDDDGKDDDDKDDKDDEKKKPSRADKPGRPDHAGSRSNGKKNRD